MNALELEIDVFSYRQHHVIVVEGLYTTQNARTGDYFVTLGQRTHHLRMFFLSLALRSDGNKVKKNKQADQESDLEQFAAPGCRLASLRVCLCDEKAHG